MIQRLYQMLILLLAGYILGGCSEQGSGGSIMVNPARGEPVVIDAALAIAINEDRPDGITNIFYDSSEQIYLWLYWANVKGRHKIEIRWFSPDEGSDDEPHREEMREFNSPNGDQITWFYINRPLSGFTEGEWFVEVFFDDLFERSYVFDIR